MRQQTPITVFPLMGCVAVERYIPQKANRPQEGQTARARGSAVKRAGKNGKKLLRDTAKATPQDEACYRLMLRNRAVQTHLIYFCGVVRYALSRHLHIAYGEYRIRLPATTLKAFHTSLRDWTRKYLGDTVSAISLGVGENNYVRLYFVTTAEDDLTVHDTTLHLVHYLRKKGAIPVLLRPYENDPLSFLQWKYCNAGVRDVEELLRGDLWLECWEVMRGSFALPYRHRALRTPQTEDLILTQAEAVQMDDSAVNNDVEINRRYNDTLSAFVAYDRE